MGMCLTVIASFSKADFFDGYFLLMGKKDRRLITELKMNIKC